ncbi:hypothetical protein XA68_12902 [Ophiocordyceps unilateralis]|uniref:CHY-type domain-containing protein n=1 Tax=Ophiocordyceps unilateralis TaxID=268505 RepID=A0A2A9PDS0_OPHUN|nr:hypothetical protein XA68_12902 [Ophiocordyceps unilateralis]
MTDHVARALSLSRWSASSGSTGRVSRTDTCVCGGGGHGTRERWSAAARTDGGPAFVAPSWMSPRRESSGVVDSELSHDLTPRTFLDVKLQRLPSQRFFVKLLSLKTSPDGSPRPRSQAVASPSPSRVVSRPVADSQTQDPRAYQLEQLRKRHSPDEATADDGAAELAFKLRPSDPDFPFELAYLDCRLRVPKAYPDERPELRVANRNMPRGFAINVERGWDRLAREREGSTLLALVNALDRHLEKFLSEQKADTVTLVTFKDTRHLDAAQSVPETATPEPEPEPTPAPRLPIAERVYTKEQMTAAKARRALEVRQLEARMGRLPGFRRSADGVVFTLPIEPKRRGELTPGLRSVCTLHLIVPLLYPLQHPRVQLNEADAADAEAVEELFAQRAASQELLSLTGHLNYLTLNLGNLERQARASKAEAEAEKRVVHLVPEGACPSEAPAPGGKGHIQVIPRPPEWTVDGSGESCTESCEEDEMSDLEGPDKEGTEQGSGVPREWPERGTLMTLPSVELQGIELLEIRTLSVRVKCDRCRTANEMTGLRPGAETTSGCSKCTAVLRATFSPQLVHANSNRAGWIEVTGGKATELLPSTFAPTCSRCSTTSAGLVSVPGERVTNVCRECHGKFTFVVGQVRFLQPAAVGLDTNQGPGPGTAAGRRRAEAARLGLRVGEELPGRGACGHYRKSHRWFRFSCCGRVHACDRCHDEAEDHVNEWANRMICGWCSREQRYAVEACGFCGRAVIGRRGKGAFWEGGKGTRDRRTMSRKDPRKYKKEGSGTQ